MKPLYFFSGQLLVCLLLASSTIGAEQIDLSNAGLNKAKADATELLKNAPDTGDPVLSVDYFLTELSKETDVEKEDPANPAKRVKSKLSINSAPLKVVQCLVIARQMLLTAQPSLPTQGDYLTAWHGRHADLLMTTGLPPKAPGKLPDNVFSDLTGEKDYWSKFLTKWETDAITKDATNFRLALQQAAYSILRVGLDKEKAQVDAVLNGGGTPSGGNRSVSGSGSGGSSSRSYHYSDVIHERLMNGIYRRHYRINNRITRVVARR